ncbi:MAG: twin-arginine translocase subunit TatC [Oligoflexales bacterium]
MQNNNQPLLEGPHGKNDPKAMSLWEHLDELRSRLIKSISSIGVLFLGAFAFANPIINFLKEPLLVAFPENQAQLHFTGPMEVFVANIKVSMLAAIVIGAPIWIYHFWKFVEPALYPQERKYIFPFILSSLTLFGAGVAFCFYFMLPLTLKYLIALGLEIGIPIITISDYLNLIIMLLFAFGAVFETPLVLVLLAMIDLIDAQMLRANRKIIIVIILIVAAVLTPPDPLSQMALAIPTYLMYEASILMISLIKREPKNVA